jgi:hypothetical protein
MTVERQVAAQKRSVDFPLPDFVKYVLMKPNYVKIGSNTSSVLMAIASRNDR